MPESTGFWYAATVAMHVIWGAYPALSRYLQADIGIPFLVIVSAAYSVIIVCMAPQAFSKENRGYFLAPGTWVFAAFTAVQGGTNMLASHFAPAYLVQMVFLGTPFLIAIISAIWIHEPVTCTTLVAMVLCLGGAMLITAPAISGGSFGGDVVTGLLVAFASAVSLAFSLAAAKGYSAPPPVLTMAFAILGVLASAPVVLLGPSPGYEVLLDMELGGWLAFAGLSLGVCVFGMVLLLACTQAIGANVVGSMLALRLVAALGFGALFPPHDVPTSWVQYVGIVVVIGSVSGYLVLKNRDDQATTLETPEELKEETKRMARRASFLLGQPVNTQHEFERVLARPGSHTLADADVADVQEEHVHTASRESVVWAALSNLIWGARLPLTLYLVKDRFPTLMVSFIVPAAVTLPFAVSGGRARYLLTPQTWVYAAVTVVQGGAATLAIDYAPAVFHTVLLITPFVTAGLASAILQEGTMERTLAFAGIMMAGALPVVLPLFTTFDADWRGDTLMQDTSTNSVNWGIICAVVNAICTALTFVAAKGVPRTTTPPPPVTLTFASSVAGAVVAGFTFGGISRDRDALSGLGFSGWVVLALLTLGVHTAGNLLLLASLQKAGPGKVAALLPLRLVTTLGLGALVAPRIWAEPWAETVGILAIVVTTSYFISSTPKHASYEFTEQTYGTL